MFKKLLILLCLSTILNAEVATKENIVKLYIASFERAPDAEGLKYWLKSGLSLEEIAKSFFDQTEMKDKYPEDTTDEVFIHSLYLNLFNRKADPKGLAYWLKELKEKKTTRSLLILALVNGATGTDAKILNNKLQVGLAFVNAGLNDTQDAYDIIQGITADVKSIDKALCGYDLDGCSDTGSGGTIPDTTAPVITLNGVSALNVVQFTTYTELGATANDARDGNVTVTSTGVVNTNIVGVYDINYTAIDVAGNSASTIRTVTVTIAPDTTAPVITLNGSTTVDVVLNQGYTEENASASDARDGNVTVVITGTVNTATLGDYNITYTATDTAGNSATATRTVSVISRWSRDSSKKIVTDHLDGYMWQDDTNASTITRNWQGAIDYCDALTFAGYTDWILPDIGRLKTIVDTTRINPAIYNSFVNIQSSAYWSSTIYVGSSSSAFLIRFVGGKQYYSGQSNSFYVRCVRDGQ